MSVLRSNGIVHVHLDLYRARVTTPSSPVGPDPDLPVSGEPDAIEPISGTPSTDAAPTSGAPAAGMPSTDAVPTSGVPAAGMPTAETPTAGVPTSGMPASAPPGFGMPTGDVPVWNAPGSGVFAGGPGAVWPAGAPVAPTRSRVGLVVGILVVVLLVLCSAGGVAAFVFVDNRGTGGSAAVKASSQASSPPKPMSVAEYQSVLTEVDGLIGPAWQKVAGAGNRTTTSEAASALAQAAKDSEARLAYLTAPPEAQAGHEHLMRAFSSAGNAFSDLALTVQRGDVCAGSSAVAQVTGSGAANEVREAVKAFGTTFTFGAWLPAPVAEQDRKLANGTYVKKGTLNGSGEFTVNNSGGDTDVVVSLVPSGTKVAATTVYVSAGSTFKVKRVRDGSYDIYLAAGADWDAGVGGFTRDCDLSKFTDPIAFKSTSRTYTTWEITLKKAVGGNAQTDSVDAADYPQ